MMSGGMPQLARGTQRPIPPTRKRPQKALRLTLTENCRREGIDPFAYLRDVFTRLGNLTNRNAPEWTPAAWARRHGLGKHAKARKAACALDA